MPKTIAKDFSITSGRGFQWKLPNGYTLSVQFGPGHYIDDPGYKWYSEILRVGDVRFLADDLLYGLRGSNTAETALLDPNGDFVPYPKRPGDDVQGHMTSAEVVEMLQWALTLPPVGTKDTYVNGTWIPSDKN